MDLVCLALFAVLLAVGLSSAGAASAEMVHVIIPQGASTQNCIPACFLPPYISVKKDTVVEWTNSDILAHTITSGLPSDRVYGTLFDSSLVPPGGRFEHNFTSDGMFHYFDLVHPWDAGVVEVSEDPGPQVPEVTASTDRETYHPGEKVTVTGYGSVQGQAQVLVRVMDPRHNIVLEASSPMSEATGSYKASFVADKRFAINGTYLLDVEYGNATCQASFRFIAVPPAKAVLHVIGPTEARIFQGQAAILALRLVPEPAYSVDSLALSLDGLPDKVLSWTDPGRLDSVIDPGHVQIPFYVNSDARAGNYTVDLIGDGTILNKTSGSDVQYTHQILATLGLEIEPSGTHVSVEVSQPYSSGTQFCTGPGGGGGMCTSFVSHQEFDVTVTAGSQEGITLGASPVPKGGFVGFKPAVVDAGPHGSVSRMILAGIMEPFGINPLDTTGLAVRAVSPDGDSGIAYVPVIKSSDITILHGPGPIPAPKDILSSGSQDQIITFGSVYAPSGGPAVLPVKIEPLGLVNGSKIAPFTRWFNVTVPHDSFALNSSEPYFFMVQSSARSLPSGTVKFALGEDVGGVHFVENATVEISNVMHGGVQTGIVSLAPPAQEQGQLQGSIPVLATAGIGGMAAAVAGTISVLVLRQRPTGP